jgi:hypothetical protein
MSVYQVAATAIALCFGLLLASFIMAEQTDEPAPTAQMNRALYAKKATPAPVTQMLRRPVRKPAVPPAVSAQMNRSLYRN